MATVYKLLTPNEANQFMTSGEFAGTQSDVTWVYSYVI